MASYTSTENIETRVNGMKDTGHSDAYVLIEVLGSWRPPAIKTRSTLTNQTESPRTLPVGTRHYPMNVKRDTTYYSLNQRRPYARGTKRADLYSCGLVQVLLCTLNPYGRVKLWLQPGVSQVYPMERCTDWTCLLRLSFLISSEQPLQAQRMRLSSGPWMSWISRRWAETSWPLIVW